MARQSNPTTSEANGRLWGARAQDWADVQEAVHRPLYEAVLAKTNVNSGTSYFDVGCGSGMAAQMARALGAEVSGLDAAADLLHIARTRTPSAKLHRGDLEKLPFADNTFDVVTGFNSFQYAGNLEGALWEARRVTKDDGWVAVVVWGRPDGMEAAEIVSALKPFMPAPPPGAPGPFALSNEDALHQFAINAGLNPAEIFDVECPFCYPNVSTAVRGQSSSGVARKAAEFSSDQAVEDAYKRVSTKFLQPDGSVRINARFLCLLARLQT
ncbi:MAG: SAM-dependent methyltransferase [Halocynthiibacter sp.]|jgi:SAM-dependent methyltransferase